MKNTWFSNVFISYYHYHCGSGGEICYVYSKFTYIVTGGVKLFWNKYKLLNCEIHLNESLYDDCLRIYFTIVTWDQTFLVVISHSINPNQEYEGLIVNCNIYVKASN